ncbi:uncharacterized protein LOC144438864 isoform X2 [Glandiceps talaboti]
MDEYERENFFWMSRKVKSSGNLSSAQGEETDGSERSRYTNLGQVPTRDSGIEMEVLPGVFPSIQYIDENDDESMYNSLSEILEEEHLTNSHVATIEATHATMKRMEKVVKLLKTEADSDFWDLTKEIATYIYYPFHETVNEDIRRQYGDFLASIDGGRELTSFLTSMLVLIKDSDKTVRAWQSIHIVQNTCWDYSNCSIPLCKQFGTCGLLNLMLCYLKKYRVKKNNTMDERQFLISALNILHNCSKVIDNVWVLKGLSAVTELSHFVIASDRELIMLTLFTLSYVIQDARVDILKTCDDTVEYIFDILRTATQSETFIGRSREGKFSAVEILKGLCNLARHNANKATFVRLEIMPLLVKLMTEGRSAEQKMATYLVQVLLRLKENRDKIIENDDIVNIVNKLSKHDTPVVQETAIKTLMDIVKPFEGEQEPIMPGPHRLSRQNAFSARRRQSYVNPDDVPMPPRRKNRSHSLGWIHE